MLSIRAPSFRNSLSFIHPIVVRRKVLDYRLRLSKECSRFGILFFADFDAVVWTQQRTSKERQTVDDPGRPMFPQTHTCKRISASTVHLKVTVWTGSKKKKREKEKEELRRPCAYLTATFFCELAQNLHRLVFLHHGILYKTR